MKKTEKKNSRNINSLLIGLLLVLITLIIEMKFPNNMFGFKNIQNMVKRNSNILDISKLYNGFFGNFYPIETMHVAKQDIDYEVSSKYLNGHIINTKQEAVISISSGVVVFCGEKEDTGKTIIIQDQNGILYTYGNLLDITKNIYCYVNPEDVIGICNNQFYLEILDGDTSLNILEVLE